MVTSGGSTAYGSMRWLLVLGLSGCSIALQGPDPAKPRGVAQTCDTDKTRVGVDGVAAGLFGIGGVVAAANNSGNGAALLFGLSAVYVASALHGSHAVDECREWQATT